MYLFFLAPIYCLKVQDTFYYCNEKSYKEAPILNVESDCLFHNKVSEYFPLELYTTAYILAKDSYEVHGKGYECKKEMIQLLTYENLFGAQSKKLSLFKIRLSRKECDEMVKTSRCEGRQMICKGNSCAYDGTPEESYSWLVKHRVEGYRCSFSPKILNAKKKTDLIIGTKCLADKLECITEDTTIIWTKDIIKHCPFVQVGFGNFTGKQDRGIVYDPDKELAFQITVQSNDCGHRLFRTREGLYLAFDREGLNWTQPSSEMDISVFHELLLTESDGLKYKTINAFKAIDRRFCEQLGMIARVMEKQEDTYNTIKDTRGQERVFYSNSGIIFVPTCYIIEEIEIEKLEKINGECSEDPTVTFSNKGINYKGYLTKSRVIRTSSIKGSCFKKHIRYLPKKAELIEVSMNGTEIIKPAHTIDLMGFGEDFRDINFPHYTKLVEDVDILAEIENELKPRLEKYDEVMEEKIVEVSELKQNIIGVVSSIENFWTKFKMRITVYFTIAFMLILFVFIATIILKTGLWKKVVKGKEEKNDDNKKEKRNLTELAYDPFTLAIVERNLNRASNVNNYF